MFYIVVATDTNGVIGREDRIPWRIRDDLVNLRNKTKNKPVILGRKTFESMAWYYNKSGKAMPGKRYIILTRDPTYEPDTAKTTVAHSIPEAIAIAEQEGSEEIPIIGGMSIYQAMLPYANTIYLTEVQTQTDGDTFFPKLDPAEWQETAREHHAQDERNEYDFDFVTLHRK